MSRPTVVRGVVLGLALVLSTGLGAAMGSTRGGHDDWGCPDNRIGHSVFTPADGGGANSQASALMSLTSLLAADGQRSEAEYADALASVTGPDRFEANSGRIYIDDRVEAEIALAQLSDHTWTVDNLRLCMRPVSPELASPYPTPDLL